MSDCHYCHQKLDDYEAVQFDFKKGRVSHIWDCLFEFVRAEMDGAVMVHRLCDNLSLSKRT